MKYFSTRDAQKNGVSASQAIVNGLAPDGGLYVPNEFPKLKNYIGKSYNDLVLEVLKLYLTDFSNAELAHSIRMAYDMCLPVKLHENYLELFHGRTAAFKDVALQLFPHLLSKSLEKCGVEQETVILTATSGDTGSAVLAGIANVPKIRAMVFYPHGGVSDVQRLQMTTQEGRNLDVFAINGNFDDAQSAVKEVFADEDFKAQFANKYLFTSANSINLGRLLPQIVYYFYAYSELAMSGKIKKNDKINFVVPTGNFGNILAGYYAYKMGLPINKLICAANSNNVLFDFIKTGVYDKNRDFKLTLSPSMDILISSNLERLIYDIGGSEVVNTAYDSLKSEGKFNMKGGLGKLFDTDFADDAETIRTIKRVYKKDKYIIDPHTAVAQCVYEKYKKRTGDMTCSVIHCTASPHKFPEAVRKAIGKAPENPPENISSLAGKSILHNAVVDDIKSTVSSALRTIRVPATSANVGCGFDSVGFAVNLFLDVEIIEPSDKWEIQHDLGNDIPMDESNYIIKTALGIVPNLAPHKLRMKSDIPLERGLGSSSSALIAGIELACELGNQKLSMQEKLEIACRIEGHADNVAPALLGGLVISSYNNGKLEYVKLKAPEVTAIAYVPNYKLATVEMRKVLPSELSFAQAVCGSSISNVMVACLASGNMQQAGRLIEQDMFHERFRSKLIPELEIVRKIAHDVGAYATYLSGAGPTIMCLVHPSKANKLVEALRMDDVKVLKLQIHE